MKAFKALLGAVCAVSLMGCSATPQQETKADDGQNAVIETIMTVVVYASTSRRR